MRHVLLLAVALSGAAMAADEFTHVTVEGRRVGESPRTMFFEVKLSPFTPLIDRPFSNLPAEQRPYYAIFGGGAMLVGELQLDYQFFQRFGSLAAGLAVGYGEKFGRAISADTGQRADQSTGLRILPLKALLTYRFDWPKLKWGVPLVPYAKGAFVVMPWWVVNGGEIEVFQGERGEGVKFGLAGTLGIALELDFLDPRLARDFDSSVGVNHTYLFAEGTLQEMNVFSGAGQPFDLSSHHFMFGLGFEF